MLVDRVKEARDIGVEESSVINRRQRSRSTTQRISLLITYFINSKLTRDHTTSGRHAIFTPLDPQAWTDGIKDAYAGLAPRLPDASLKPAFAHAYAHAYASGRVEGEALRLKHRHKYEQLVFSGRRTRAMPQEPANE